MEQAAIFGLTPGDTWTLTLRELTLYMRGRAEDQRNTWKRAAWGAFHGAVFGRMKRLSGESLKRLIRNLDRPERRRQTPEQMYRMAELWTAVLAKPGKDRGPNG